jgi:hypothetical protein
VTAPNLATTLRAAFDAAGRRRSFTASWDDLRELYASPCNSFRAIGDQLGVTRERARQIYNEFFWPLLGMRKYGRQRRKVCSRKRRAVRIASLEPVGIAALAARFARMAGCLVTGAPRACGALVKARVAAMTHGLIVNGHHCSVIRLFPKVIGTTPYLVARIRVLPGEVTHVAFVNDDNCYVLPGARAVIGRAMYIPTGERASVGRRPRISFEEWERCRQAWPGRDD